MNKIKSHSSNDSPPPQLLIYTWIFYTYTENKAYFSEEYLVPKIDVTAYLSAASNEGGMDEKLVGNEEFTSTPFLQLTLDCFSWATRAPTNSCPPPSGRGNNM